MAYSIGVQLILAIWSPDLKFKIVRVRSTFDQVSIWCHLCGHYLWLWPMQHRIRTIVVSSDGVARYCMMCLLEVCETGFVRNWTQMPDDGPNPLEAIARDYFENGFCDGYIELAKPH